MLSGLLPRPEQTMAMMGITFNIHALCFFAAHGLSGAASTRVGNDLGAGRPHMAWLTVQVRLNHVQGLRCQIFPDLHVLARSCAV
jgi:MATE family multidrug resistance protein